MSSVFFFFLLLFFKSLRVDVCDGAAGAPAQLPAAADTMCQGQDDMIVHSVCRKQKWEVA